MHFWTTSVAVACLSSFAAAAPARAVGPNYSVTAHAVTGGMPGSGASYVGPLTGQTSADAQHDPAGTTWAYYSTQILYSDAAAFAWSDLGSLSSHVSAEAARVQATSFPAAVAANTSNRFTDRFVVASASLPKNTPVTLTFRAELSVAWDGSGLYDGRAGCSVQIGASSASPKWSESWNKGSTPAVDATCETPLVEVTPGVHLVTESGFDYATLL